MPLIMRVGSEHGDASVSPFPHRLSPYPVLLNGSKLGDASVKRRERREELRCLERGGMKFALLGGRQP
jgi:hypothetical protein